MACNGGSIIEVKEKSTANGNLYRIAVMLDGLHTRYEMAVPARLPAMTA
ncbi:MAG: hypothetical protein R3F37_19960 [Candidatus Competibacteraceae bacterium]